MNHQDLINTCVFEQFEGLLFSDLSGPLTERAVGFKSKLHYKFLNIHNLKCGKHLKLIATNGHIFWSSSLLLYYIYK